MKRIFQFISYLIAFVGCTPIDSQTSQVRSSAVLNDIFIFIDKSKSVSYLDPVVFAKAEEEFRNAMSRAFQPGDRISIYYIHDNTSGATKDDGFVLPEYDPPPNPSTIELSNYDQTYQYGVALGKSRLLGKFTSALKRENHPVAERGTDIIGALDRVSEFCMASSKKYIYLFTDGIQAKNQYGGQFESIPGATRQADLDLSKLAKDYSIDKDKIAGSSAIMVLPYDPFKTSHKKYIDQYWKRFFNGLGVKFEPK